MWDILAGGDFVRDAGPAPAVAQGRKLPRRRITARDRRPVGHRCRPTPHLVSVQPAQLALLHTNLAFPSLLVH